MNSPLRAAVLCGFLLSTPLANASEPGHWFTQALQDLKAHWLLGITGTSGTEGIIGTSGTEGITGTSGTEGITGTSGTEGITGTSG